MLSEFLATNHDELVKRCKAKVADRPAPQSAGGDSEYGVSLLLGQLVDELRVTQTADPDAQPAKLPADIGSAAGKHGNEMLLKGYTIDQVVHDYGDLCQAVTELAHEKEAPITVEEFHTFNRCLDNAIADAVTEFGRQRDQLTSERGIETVNERLGSLAHELGNRLGSGMLAFQAIKKSNMTLSTATGDLLGRSLTGLRAIIDRSLADVRLTDGLRVRREAISVRTLLGEIHISATMDAKARGVALAVAPVDEDLWIDADRAMIFSAVTNLLQNAFKFTRKDGQVSLRAHKAAGRVAIEIEDECGGLPPGKTEEMFQPFVQRSADRTGVGLGLSISRRGVDANGGTLRVRSLPGKGCIFTIELPLRASRPTADPAVPGAQARALTNGRS